MEERRQTVSNKPPMFERRHYGAVADKINSARRVHGNVGPIAYLQRELATLFASDNSAFKPDVFHAACEAGTGESESRSARVA